MSEQYSSAGTWKFEKNPSHTRYLVYLDKGIQPHIAYLSDCYGEEQTIANGHLIAAAPLMLEALENIENDDKHMPASAWKLIQDAISKARGSSQKQSEEREAVK